MTSIGRTDYFGVKLHQLNTNAADATNTDRALTGLPNEPGARRMLKSITSPEPDQSPTHTFVMIPRFVIDLAAEKRCGDITQVYSALATFASKERVCWPSRQTIADTSGVSLRNVQRCLNALRDAGFITVKHGRSRSLYTLLTVPNPPHSDDIDCAKSAPVKEPHCAKSDPIGALTVPNPTGECAKNDPQNYIQRTRTSKKRTISESDDEKPESKPNPVYELWRTWADRIGVPATVRMSSKDGKLSKQLIEQGLTPDQAIELYEWLAADSFWASKGVDLGIMLSNVGKWRSVKAATMPPAPKPQPDRIAQAVAEKERLLRREFIDHVERQMYGNKAIGEDQIRDRIAYLDSVISGGIAA